MHTEGDGYEAQWAWSHLAEVREHDGGLILIFDGGISVIDIPPSAFTQVDKDTVGRHVSGWIAAARADATSPAPQG